VYIADYSNHTVRKMTPEGVVTTLAGSAGISGNVDDTGSLARFNAPNGIVVDSDGNVFVSQRSNHVIRKITPAGVVTTFAGQAGVSGSVDANGTSARFNAPASLAIDSDDVLYVADLSGHIIRKVTPTGDVTTLAGLAGVSGSSDGNGSSARFNGPFGVAVDSSKNVYVSDATNRTIRKITPAGDVTTLAGQVGVSGAADGTGTAASFDFPYQLTVDADGNVFVPDYNRHTIRKITPSGVVTTIAGVAGESGSVDGLETDAIFWAPSAMAVDPTTGDLYVTGRNNSVRRIHQ